MLRYTAWAEVDLSAIAHNYREIRKRIGKKTKFCAVIKADAYGHGAVAVARIALDEGADYLAVATLSEALKLRAAGFTTPLLILGLIGAESASEIVYDNITQTVCQMDLVEALSQEAVRQGKTVKVHLKIETGMGRIGVAPKDAADMARRIVALPNVELEGLSSHFALADTADQSFTAHQMQLFQEACDAIEAMGIHVPLKHIAASAAVLEYPDADFDMVRVGIIQYGLWPSPEVVRSMDLHPCMKFCARIVFIKTIPPGASVGYGRTFIAERETRIATLTVGYADGYIRAYGSGSVEVCGKRAPIAGRICMDQFMIDVTDIPEAQVGDVCTLFGSETLSVDEVAAWAHTINYEVLCLISTRVPRVYIE